MNLMVEKVKEVTRTLVPVIVLVLLLCLTIVDVEADIMVRFIIGSILLLMGLSIFLWGVDLSMNSIGEHMSREIATSKSIVKIGLLSFLLGFLISVAEPDLLVLGSQIQKASDSSVSSTLVVYVVSFGVGAMVLLGVFRLLKDKSYSMFMVATYVIISILAIFVSEEFLAISFDASGATTGALTTPFILAISLGLSKVKGGKHAEENSFGLVGIMSAGPILAIMLMSIITGQKNIQGTAEIFTPTNGVLSPILRSLPATFLESIRALLPIATLFFIFNFKKFKLAKDEILLIIKGLLFTLLGLTLFLTAVNTGFMDMGRIIGMSLAQMSPWVLIGIGLVLGLIVVLVEPAVHVLGEQIEEVTAGHIPIKLIRTTLSLGVGIAIALSMVRIIVPGVKLWYFIIPGFFLAMILSFFADPFFIGIAYDAGGVASGPMTATFVLAFAQGAADMTPTANVLIDGFGVIAMVAMAPVLSIMIVGTIFKHKKRAEKTVKDEKYAAIPMTEVEEEFADGILHDCIVVVVNRGFAEDVVNISRESGARGATIIHGRGLEEREHEKVRIPLINIELQPEKEIIWLITKSNVSMEVIKSLLSDSMLNDDGEIAIYTSPTEAMLETFTIPNNPASIDEE